MILDAAADVHIEPEAIGAAVRMVYGPACSNSPHQGARLAHPVLLVKRTKNESK